ncbi:50S ribosomal protein L11 methyltransferase [Listeria innocua]|uniref:50S ribosomal protein L11 methyltransferase n=2 Tax=Listeria innocua TaxID=1642 RepID=UPI00085C162C|nr:50S ribosomal protein L11 methyltransferase [Listeria innocua]OET38746.1 ribosomal protein L11 methyltransferase [Listeria monocytogenes]UVD67118.1 50S ribosomal protein L11 methyltransferase [Listeria innocua]HAA0649439.1 50S ribosomal protein L11 methyltransferase [Listeria innocua]
MEWSEVEVHTTNEAVEPVANVLTEFGAAGVSIEDVADFLREREDKFGEIYALKREDYPEDGVIIKAYFLKTTEFVEQIPEIEQTLKNLTTFDIPLGKFQFVVNDVDDEEWATAWKKYYHPVQITDRITIVPSWESYTASANEIIIELDPGMAFGTGTHPTTQLCIRALSDYLQPGDELIDVGTGSGVLSIASAKLGAKSILATDLDEIATRAAEENITLNKTEHIITVKQNNLLQDINKTNVDIVVANILAEVILLFPEDVYKALKPGGIFIASGIIEDKAKVVEEALKNAGLIIEKIEQQGDWVAIISKRGVE